MLIIAVHLHDLFTLQLFLVLYVYTLMHSCSKSKYKSCVCELVARIQNKSLVRLCVDCIRYCNSFLLLLRLQKKQSFVVAVIIT